MKLKLGTNHNVDLKKFVHNGEKELEDKENGITRKRRREIEIMKLMNSINSDLKSTTEKECDFDNQRLPTLSFEL